MLDEGISHDGWHSVIFISVNINSQLIKFHHLGLVCISIFCFLNMLPHFLYGAGNDALSLTEEFGNGLSSFSDDSPSVILNEFKNKTLCHRNCKLLLNTFNLLTIY